MNLKFAYINSSLVCQEKPKAEDDGLWRNMNAIFLLNSSLWEKAVIFNSFLMWGINNVDDLVSEK